MDLANAILMPTGGIGQMRVILIFNFLNMSGGGKLVDTNRRGGVVQSGGISQREILAWLGYEVNDNQ